jgi:hypothetical protein
MTTGQILGRLVDRTEATLAVDALPGRRGAIVIEVHGGAGQDRGVQITTRSFVRPSE